MFVLYSRCGWLQSVYILGSTQSSCLNLEVHTKELTGISYNTFTRSMGLRTVSDDLSREDTDLDLVSDLVITSSSEGGPVKS